MQLRWIPAECFWLRQGGRKGKDTVLDRDQLQSCSPYGGRCPIGQHEGASNMIRKLLIDTNYISWLSR